MDNVEKSFSCAILVFVVVCGFVFVSNLPCVVAQDGLITVISSDTTWTKANIPNQLSGDVLVKNGATLTIEAGATLDLNSNDIVVNGTLRILGIDNDPVNLTCVDTPVSKITITEYGNGWDEQTESGCVINQAILHNVDIYSSVSVKVNNCDIDYRLTIDGASIIQSNTISAISITGGTAEITNNDIGRIDDCYGTPEISYNTFEAIGGSDHFCGSPVISHNSIKESLIFTGDSPVISDNTFLGYVYGHSSTLDLGTPTEVLDIIKPTTSFTGNGGSPIIANNIITCRTYTYVGFLGETGTTTTSGIVIKGTNENAQATNNTITNCRTGISGATTITDNIIINSTSGISSGKTITGNLIVNSTTGIRVSITDVTIQNNTIQDTETAIFLSECPSASINYNNIGNYTENSLYISQIPANIDATNNWWGTTDTQAINLSIRDFKYDLNLGTVNFVPFLTEPNPQAPEVPEFPAWIILPMALALTLTVIVFRKNLVKRTAK